MGITCSVCFNFVDSQIQSVYVTRLLTGHVCGRAVQESVRRVVVEHTPDTLAGCADERVRSAVLGAVTKLMADRSWRVRFCMAQTIVKIADAFGPKVVRCATRSSL